MTGNGLARGLRAEKMRKDSKVHLTDTRAWPAAGPIAAEFGR